MALCIFLEYILKSMHVFNPTRKHIHNRKRKVPNNTLAYLCNLETEQTIHIFSHVIGSCQSTLMFITSISLTMLFTLHLFMLFPFWIESEARVAECQNYACQRPCFKFSQFTIEHDAAYDDLPCRKIYP